MFKRLLLIAHRGYSSEAPENTFSAFDLAIERGYHDIELDVQLSRDGVPVIIHDETLERTTNGVGRVADHSYAELSKLDAGSWFAPSFADQRVPSLEDFLIFYKDTAYLHLEIKSSEAVLPRKIAELIISTGWAADRKEKTRHKFTASWHQKLAVSSYDRKQLLRSIKAMPEQIVHDLLVLEVTDESLQWAATNGMRSYYPDGKDITPELVLKAHKLYLRIGAWWWTRQEQDVRPLLHSGVYYALVDAPLLHRRNVLLHRK
jgi:glycerophosphoryl diester phosphodiesterase